MIPPRTAAAMVRKVVRGRVEPLAAVVSPQQAAAAAARISRSLEEERGNADRLWRFKQENAELCTLVRALPDKTSHAVMVRPRGLSPRPAHHELTVLLGKPLLLMATGNTRCRPTLPHSSTFSAPLALPSAGRRYPRREASPPGAAGVVPHWHNAQCAPRTLPPMRLGVLIPSHQFLFGRAPDPHQVTNHLNLVPARSARRALCAALSQVPFGRAAFFPGRLVHTNELTLLLGDGLYAERSASQALGVLRRRGAMIERQLEGCQAKVEDLRGELRFAEQAGADAEVREEREGGGNVRANGGGWEGEEEMEGVAQQEGCVEIHEYEEEVEGGEQEEEGGKEEGARRGEEKNSDSKGGAAAGDPLRVVGMSREADGGGGGEDEEERRIDALFAEMEAAEAAAGDDDEEEEEESEEEEEEDEDDEGEDEEGEEEGGEEEEEWEEEEEDDEDEEEEGRGEQERRPEAPTDRKVMEGVSAVRIGAVGGPLGKAMGGIRAAARQGIPPSHELVQGMSAVRIGVAVGGLQGQSVEGGRGEAQQGIPPPQAERREVGPSASQLKAFSGAVVERTSDCSAPPPLPVVPPAPSPARPLSRFKQRRAGQL
ncbi:unnamed protein product [Closterium sp. Yama58-4]|nr:unnamed protein product [Closterium sp. Yama58-4]